MLMLIFVELDTEADVEQEGEEEPPQNGDQRKCHHTEALKGVTARV